MHREHKLGARVKSFRQDRNISLEMLAETTGLTVEALTSLEENDLYPSMDDEITRDPIISSLEKRESDLAMHQTLDSNVHYSYHSLGKGKSDRNMDPFHIEIYPKPGDDLKTASHQGEEFMLVLKGELLVVYGRQTHVLKAGQTIYYNAIVPHYVGSANDEPVEILAVIFNP